MIASKGGSACPTEPGWVEPVVAVDRTGRADLGGAVGLEEHRPPPVDHGPLHLVGALGAGVRHVLHRGHVVAVPHLLGQGQQAHEVGGHHHRAAGAVPVDGGQGRLGVEAARGSPTACRPPGSSSPTADPCGTSGRPPGAGRSPRTGPRAGRRGARPWCRHRRTWWAAARCPWAARSCRRCRAGWDGAAR